MIRPCFVPGIDGVISTLVEKLSKAIQSIKSEMTSADTRIAQLQETFKLLQLLQHRHAPWWKWLSMLKRCVDNLIKELRRPDHATSTARLSYMKDILIPKCYV